MESTEHIAPKRGEVWLVAFGAGREGEPTKTRPAVVISANEQSTHSIHDLVIVVPLSSSLEVTPARPGLSVSSENGLLADSVVVARSIRGVPLSRFCRRLGRIDVHSLRRIELVLMALMDLPLS